MQPLCVFLLMCLLSPQLVSCLTVDGVALITFKKFLVADPQSALANWNVSDDSPCAWNGVVCTNVPGSAVPRVVGLSVIGKNLSGPVAPALGALDALRRLSLQDNNLTGRLPAQLFNATSLQTILLNTNHLSGRLPPEIGHLTGLQTLDISSNALSGTIPQSITKCMSLQTLLLANNFLTGSIPPGIGAAFHSLEQLDLSANHLSGAIPEDLGKLSSLQGTLNLSYNRFSGRIPPTLGELPYSVSLDFSHNNLSGMIPQNGSLGAQGPGPFEGNPGLCGFPSTVACHFAPPLPSLPAEGPASSSSQRNITRGFRKTRLSAEAIVGIAVGDAMGISVAALLLLYWYSRTRMCHERASTPSALTAILSKKNNASRKCLHWSSEMSSEASESPDKGKEQGELVALDRGFSSDLDELLRSSAYVLGKSGQGIVYKVVLASGKSVAVRRLGEGGNQKQQEFEGEVQAISKVRHPNVVRLLAYYWSADEKLLIYDYISHGTLAAALHGSTKSPTTAVTWTQRLLILQGVAKGLAHIHDNNPRKHVHGDIKSSKILLGPSHQAHVADFGVSKLISIATDAEPPHAPRVSNSSRPYRAPESLTGESAHRPSQKWDVYSFGVVILEVLSGRSPLAQMATAGIDLVSWIRSAVDDGRPSETFTDLSVGTMPSSLVPLLDLGLRCVAPSPDLRPKMRDVADTIKKLAKSA